MLSSMFIGFKHSSSLSQRLNKESEFLFVLYSQLFYERSKKQDEIKKALSSKLEKFEFASWWRSVPFKYTINPLSSKGSLNSPYGGRFNIGQIETTNTGKFSPFPALYLGDSKKVAEEECGYIIKKTSKLSTSDITLRSNEERQDTYLKVKGSICLIDITKPYVLSPFVKVIKDMSYSKELLKEIKQRKLKDSKIKTVQDLKRAIYDKEWRLYISLYGLPSPSQVFSQIVRSCGIEGILYRSTRYQKGSCLAIFLDNFSDSSSYVELMMPEHIKSL